MPGVVGDEREYDDFEEEMALFPITDLDYNPDLEDENYASNKQNNKDSLERDEWKPIMTLKQRRHRKLSAIPDIDLSISQTRKPTLMSLDSVEDDSASPSPTIAETLSPKLKWQRAFKKIKNLSDPWAKYRIEDQKTEVAIRHRYNALRKSWVKDEIRVKLQTDPFNHGAMRSCYRLKKLSNFTHSRNWRHAANYVAKRYMEDVDREVYFLDVELQMDAKLWGEEFNRHNPPKKVDIFQMCCIEFKDREGSPLYHLEHFIEGDYIKYNSNSGFVDENLRLTPHAFSHFTFERSGHQLIIVDIQGVGDLWTDPQIHTHNGVGYNDGNLGTRGMALFFHSHVCNKICESLSLSKFDLAASENATLKDFLSKQKNRRMTVVRGCEEMCVAAASPPVYDIDHMAQYGAARQQYRMRTISSCSARSYNSVTSITSDEGSIQSSHGDLSPPDSAEIIFGSLSGHHHHHHSGTPGSHGGSHHHVHMDVADEEDVDSVSSPIPVRRGRVRFTSESSSCNIIESGDSLDNTSKTRPICGSPDVSTFHSEEDRLRFQQAVSRAHRPSCYSNEVNLRRTSIDPSDSVLGLIHHDLAKYHDLGRFSLNDDHVGDFDAALFHEECAASLGVLEAMETLAHLYLDMDRNIFVDHHMQSTDVNVNKGIDYMLQAANAGSRAAMIYMAKAFETGVGLGSIRRMDLGEAMHWYEESVHLMESKQTDLAEFDATMDTPVYQLQAKMAELHMCGGDGLDKDPNKAGELYSTAAEGAMEAMKGRLANKYYALSEEAYALVEE